MNNSIITDYAVEMYCELDGKNEHMKKTIQASSSDFAYARACKMFPDWVILCVYKI